VHEAECDSLVTSQYDLDDELAATLAGGPGEPFRSATASSRAESSTPSRARASP
jgi:hypothetical protein